MEKEELSDLEQDINSILNRLPTNSNSKFDKEGRLALAANCKAKNPLLVKTTWRPRGEAVRLDKGRHQAKMEEPTPTEGSPDEIVFLILGSSSQFSDACLRAYGHPDLLELSAAVNGEDFVPYTDGLFIKAPWFGEHQLHGTRMALLIGTVLNWHQGSHGFNLMGQVYGYRR